MRKTILLVHLFTTALTFAQPRPPDNLDRLVRCEPHLLEHAVSSFDAEVFEAPSDMPKCFEGIRYFAVFSAQPIPRGRRLVLRTFKKKKLKSFAEARETIDPGTLNFIDLPESAFERLMANGRRLGRLAVAFRRGVIVEETSPTSFKFGEIIKIKKDHFGVIQSTETFFREPGGQTRLVPQYILADFGSFKVHHGAVSTRRRRLDVLGPDSFRLDHAPVVVIQRLGNGKISHAHPSSPGGFRAEFQGWRKRCHDQDAWPHVMMIGPFNEIDAP